MARRYELKSRAEGMEATRRRIVEAAIDLHRTKGPARTTLSDIARRAGVQRHTLYRHFPDERAMFLACSGHYGELNPAPDPSEWRAMADPAERLRAGLSAIYDYFERTQDMLDRVLRDAQVHELTGEMVQLRRAAPQAEVRSILGEALPHDEGRVAAALDLALDFRAWQRLARSGLSREDAVETMVAAVLAQQ